MNRGIFRIILLNLTCILCVFYFSFSILTPAESLTINKKEEKTEIVNSQISENEEKVIGYGDFSVLMFAIRNAAAIYPDAV